MSFVRNQRRGPNWEDVKLKVFGGILGSTIILLATIITAAHVYANEDNTTVSSEKNNQEISPMDLWKKDSKKIKEIFKDLRKHAIKSDDTDLSEETKKDKIQRLLKKKNREYRKNYKRLQLARVEVKNVKAVKFLTDKGKRMKKQLMKKYLGKKGAEAFENSIAFRLRLAFTDSGAIDKIKHRLNKCDDCYKRGYKVTFKIPVPDNDHSILANDGIFDGYKKNKFSETQSVKTVDVAINYYLKNKQEALKFRKGKNYKLNKRIWAIEYESSSYDEDLKIIVVN